MLFSHRFSTTSRRLDSEQDCSRIVNTMFASKFALSLIFAISCVTPFSAALSSSRDSPDVRLVKEIAWNLWLDRDVIVQETLESLMYADYDIDEFMKSFEYLTSDPEPEERVDCPGCVVSTCMYD